MSQSIGLSECGRGAPGLLSLTLLLSALAGCSPEGVVVGATAVTLAGASSPGHELEQIYYFGVFDPHEQLPPAFYRITVRGQSSALSGLRFASGWVPAGVADGLGTNIRIDPNSNEPVEITGDPNADRFKPGRRLILFGPEGFRESPANHRLVIAMGTSAQSYFDAINQVLSAIDPQRTATSKVKQDMLNALVEASRELDELQKLRESLVESATSDANKAEKKEGSS